ncbi:MAG: hypothetical protein P4L85_15130 [Paludisphaera borealis]|uniref:hypothetical protein n=1 Tax=Paludisphaera borealis TaxID=1387353 RepID=UPI00283EFD8C|nr:hypothetical protein [Paludisphaera borealis]MDR3620683.1 hypothetical protein [Paludisphaera borealis]
MRRAIAIWVVLAAASTPAGASADDPTRMRPLPLGVTWSVEGRDRHFGVYIPTQFGGVLTVETTSGTVGPIEGPDGRQRPNGQGLAPGVPGWYTFAIEGATSPFSVATSFVQVGRSARKPWNYYYWPTKSDAIHEPWADGNGRVDTVQVFGDDVLVATPGAPIAPGQDIVRAGPNGLLETPVAAGDDSTWFPNLYDDVTFQAADGTVHETPCPLLKYDLLYRSSARSWEAGNSQNHNVSRWPGHCLGGAVASILLNEPVPSPGSGLTRDELKALWAELGENHLNHRIGDHVVDIAAGPPVPGPDPCDRSVVAFHRLLEEQLLGRGVALLGNLRGFPPRGTTDEVWNHGVGGYTAHYRAVQERDVLTVRVDVEIEANSGSSLNGQDEHSRLIRYAYTLAYGRDGRIDASRTDACDWISVDGDALFAPLNLMVVESTRWVGHNPYVTEANVRALDLANGGDPSRYTAAPPQLLPVASTETTSRRLAFGRGAATAGPPRRGGFTRLFNRQ